MNLRAGISIAILAFAGAAPAAQAATVYGPVAVPKTEPKKLYVHVMPWFETKASSGTGSWGIHWTMANRNPDVIDGSGRRQIASYYYPMIGPYASGDHDVVGY